jgi:ubiquinone/menaquinone biosynthesis C-methylase UbiE
VDHRDVTRREFARQVGEFERPDSFFGDRQVLEWIAAHVPVGSDDVVLDVAGGAGHVGRHLATQAAFAVVVDLTREMLQAGVNAGSRNTVFVEGDATALPFADGQFDVVVCRFAFHHIDEPARAATEMARVARPGGTVAVIDMVSRPGPAGARHNELERMRDPSHTRALEEDELLATLDAAGVNATVVAARRQPMPAVPWLERAASPDAPREEILAALEAEVAGGEATGLHAAADPLRIHQDWVIASGTRR